MERQRTAAPKPKLHVLNPTLPRRQVSGSCLITRACLLRGSLLHLLTPSHSFPAKAALLSIFFNTFSHTPESLSLNAIVSISLHF